MKAILVYTTLDSLKDAEELAGRLVEEKLAGCANIYAGNSSFYRWEGKVCRGAEVALILKTKEELWEPIRDRIATLHPYKCPAILALPIKMGHEPYLQWLYGATL